MRLWQPLPSINTLPVLLDSVKIEKMCVSELVCCKVVFLWQKKHAVGVIFEVTSYVAHSKTSALKNVFFVFFFIKKPTDKSCRVLLAQPGFEPRTSPFIIGTCCRLHYRAYDFANTGVFHKSVLAITCGATTYAYEP